MKMLAVFLLTISARAATFRPDHPPFYTMTFEEVERLRQPYYGEKTEQLKTYLRETFSLIRQIQLKDQPMLGVGLAAFEGLSQSADTWNPVREKVFAVCEAAKTGPNHLLCKSLLQTRQKALVVRFRPD